VRWSEPGTRIAHLGSNELPLARRLDTEIYGLTVTARMQKAVGHQFVDEETKRLVELGPQVSSETTESTARRLGCPYIPGDVQLEAYHYGGNLPPRLSLGRFV
jgi:hypothetical protein